MLLLVSYLLLSSSYFLESFLLPQISKHIDIPIEVGEIEFSPLVSLKVEKLRIGNKEVPFLKLEKGELFYDLLSFFEKKVIIKDVVFRKMRIHLEKTPQGELRLISFEPTAESSDEKENKKSEVGFSFLNVAFEDSEIFLENSPEDFHFHHVNIDTKKLLIDSVGRISFEGEIRGKANTKTPTEVFLKLALSQNAEKISLKNGFLQLSQGEKEVGDLSFGSDWYFSDKTESQIEVVSKEILVDSVTDIIKELVDKLSTIDSLEENESLANKTDSKLNIKTTVSIEKVNYQGFEFNNVLVDGSFKNDIFETKGAHMAYLDGAVDCDLLLGFSLEKDPFEYNCAAKDIELKSLTKAFFKNEKPISGKLLSLNMKGEGNGFISENLTQSLSGNIKTEFQDVLIPTSFQNEFPFNILFLPFKVVGNVSSRLAGWIIPENLSEKSEEVSSELEEGLLLPKSFFDIKINQGVVTISEGYVDSSYIPKVSFPGTVNLIDNSLDIRSKLTLLGLSLPLPIGGSTNVPLPNVPIFLTEVVKGLGLSVVEGVTSLTNSEEEVVEPKELKDP